MESINKGRRIQEILIQKRLYKLINDLQYLASKANFEQQMLNDTMATLRKV